MQNLSRCFTGFCAYGLPSTIQTTCFRQGLSPETETAIAKRLFCFHRIISVLILKNVWGHFLLEGPPIAKSQVPGRGNQVFG